MNHTEFAVGDVVADVDAPAALGIVTEVRARSVNVVWEHGGSSGGPGLVAVLQHREPLARVHVPPGAKAVRAWNREQAVKAVLRRAGVLPSLRSAATLPDGSGDPASATMPPVTPLALQLREAIEASGLTTAEVARRAGMQPPSLHRALGAEGVEDPPNVSEETLRRVCEVLKLEAILVPEGAAQSVRNLIAALRTPP